MDPAVDAVVFVAVDLERINFPVKHEKGTRTIRTNFDATVNRYQMSASELCAVDRTVAHRVNLVWAKRRSR